MPLTKAAFSRKVGVSRPAVTIAVREGRLPVLQDGKIDPSDPVVAAFIAKHTAPAKPAVSVKPKPELETPPIRKPGPRPKPGNARPVTEPVGWRDDGSPAALAKLGRLTLDKVSRLFGGVVEAEAWLKAAKLKEDIRAARLKNEIAEGEVVSRDLVRTHVMSVVDEAFRRLLSDGAKTIAAQVYAFAQSNPPVPIQKAEEEIAQIVSKILERAQNKTRRALRGK